MPNQELVNLDAMRRLDTAGTQVDRSPRCQKCGAELAGYTARPWSIRCDECGRLNKSGKADA